MSWFKPKELKLNIPDAKSEADTLCELFQMVEDKTNMDYKENGLTWDEYVEGLAREQELTVLEQSLKKYDEYVEDWHIDINSYEFSCKRYGDFLTVFITRDGKKFVTSINLMESNTVTPIHGLPPSKNGMIAFSVSFKRKLEDEYGGWCSSDGLRGPLKQPPEGYVKQPPEGYEYRVRPFDFARKHDKPFTMETKNYDSFGGNSQRWTKFFVNGTAQQVIDDRIQFSGITLMVPHSLGDSVFEKIMKEIGKGR